MSRKRKLKRLRLVVKYLIDWPRGSKGYVPWTRRLTGSCGVSNDRTKLVIRVDLERVWKLGRQEARRFKKSQFDMFLDEFIDTVIHEYVHRFQPPYSEHKKYEEEALRFSKVGRWTRYPPKSKPARR